MQEMQVEEAEGMTAYVHAIVAKLTDWLSVTDNNHRARIAQTRIRTASMVYHNRQQAERMSDINGPCSA